MLIFNFLYAIIQLYWRCSMDYDKIILELLDRIQTLESKVREIEGKTSPKQGQENLTQNKSLTKKINNKYRRLTEYLLDSDKKVICLTYPQIEAILGFPLPNSAKNHMRSFWANTETHSYASSWLAVGYRTNVNLINKTVTFEKALTLTKEEQYE